MLYCFCICWKFFFSQKPQNLHEWAPVYCVPDKNLKLTWPWLKQSKSFFTFLRIIQSILCGALFEPRNKLYAILSENRSKGEKITIPANSLWYYYYHSIIWLNLIKRQKAMSHFVYKRHLVDIPIWTEDSYATIIKAIIVWLSNTIESLALWLLGDRLVATIFSFRINFGKISFRHRFWKFYRRYHRDTFHFFLIQIRKLSHICVQVLRDSCGFSF